MDPFEEADNGPARDLREMLEEAVVFGEGGGNDRPVSLTDMLKRAPRSSIVVIERQGGPYDYEIWIRLPDGRSIPCKAVPNPDRPGWFTIVPEPAAPS